MIKPFIIRTRYVNIFLFVVIISSFENCRLEDNIVQSPLSNNPQPEIVGFWNWIESENIGGHLTPQRVSYTRQEKFTSKNIWSAYQNDTLLLTEPYKIERDIYPPFMRDSADVLKIYDSFTDSWIPWDMEFPTKDTVILRGLFFDGGYKKFERIY